MPNNIITTVHTDSGIEMKSEGDFVIANSEAIKKALMDSVMRNGAESLLLTNVTAIDVSGIQLAYAWKKTLESLGRNAKVIMPQTPEIKDLLQKTGINQIF